MIESVEPARAVDFEGDLTFVMIMVLKVDLQCCRCYKKVKKLLNGWGMSSFMYVVDSFLNWRILALIVLGLFHIQQLFLVFSNSHSSYSFQNHLNGWQKLVETELETAQGGISELFQKKYVRPLLVRHVNSFQRGDPIEYDLVLVK
ncbi:Proline-rich protein [Corchorus olitorius]|uniref:Proline-rich protein n=1 Tax=Corchorus olitorius TaxID=93759 RepID=A0A1R3INK1_9ROSI|nr:Proline-rich protein [Corchorus olitorius]